MKGYCPNCEQNVRGVKKKITLGRFLMTAGVGRFATMKNKCPMCYSTIIYSKSKIEELKKQEVKDNGRIQ